MFDGKDARKTGEWWDGIEQPGGERRQASFLDCAGWTSQPALQNQG